MEFVGWVAKADGGREHVVVQEGVGGEGGIMQDCLLDSEESDRWV